MYKREEKDCPKCSGTGIIAYANMGEHQCYYCNGKGKIAIIKEVAGK